MARFDPSDCTVSSFHHFAPPELLKRHIATANGVSQAQFALDVLTKVMPIYEKMFDIEYPLPKLDILAVSIGSS